MLLNDVKSDEIVDNNNNNRARFRFAMIRSDRSTTTVSHRGGKDLFSSFSRRPVVIAPRTCTRSGKFVFSRSVVFFFYAIWLSWIRTTRVAQLLLVAADQFGPTPPPPPPPPLIRRNQCARRLRVSFVIEAFFFVFVFLIRRQPINVFIVMRVHRSICAARVLI